MNKCLTTITVAAVLIMSGAFSTFAQEAKNLEDALKKSRTHDNVDPEYSQPMGQRSAAGTTDALLKVNHANGKQLEAYDNFFKENDERHLDELKQLVAIQSLAMLPEHAPDVLKAAEFIKQKLDAIGMQNATIHETDGYYTLTAEWMNAPGQPTALFYGHFDVQPATPDLWDTDPWKAEIRDGKMYGRGATDDKGPVMALLSALEAMLKIDGKLPVNVMLTLDGSEEYGSSTWPKWLAQPEMKTWLAKADYGFNVDAAIQSDTQGLIWRSFRGFTDVEVTLTSAKGALHSGGFGGPVPNSAIAAGKVIASMFNDDGTVAIEGWYDDQMKMPKEVRQELAALSATMDYDAIREKYGINQFIGEKDYSPIERIWIRGSMDVTGVKSGYTEGAASIIPETAWFRVMARLGPGMNAEKTRKQIMAHIEKNVPWGLKVEMKNTQNCNPVWIDTDNRGLQISKAVQTEVFGQPTPVLYVGGGVGPASFIADAGGPKLISFGFQQADENFHGNNEYMRITSWEKAQRAYPALFHALVGQPLKEQ